MRSVRLSHAYSAQEPRLGVNHIKVLPNLYLFYTICPCSSDCRLSIELALAVTVRFALDVMLLTQTVQRVLLSCALGTEHTLPRSGCG